jgi:1-acyl-sn-glycerol-3-phosphate acyltransferase
MEAWSNRLVRWGFRGVLRGAVELGRLLYGMEIEGREHLPRQGPLIVIGRHGSRVDFFGIAFLLTAFSDIHYLTAALTLGNSRLRTRLGRAVGALPLFKEKGMTAVPLMELCKTLQRGKIVGLMAHEISWDGRNLLPMPGAAWLGLRTGAPVIAVGGEGGYDIWPRWARRPHLTGKLVLRIGKPFHLCDAPVQRVTAQRLHEASLRIKAEMEAVCRGYASSRTMFAPCPPV